MITYGFKKRSELLSDLSDLLRLADEDAGKLNRWSVAELEITVNLVLNYWSGTVYVPASYALDSTGPVNLPWFAGSVEMVFSVRSLSSTASFHLASFEV